VFREVSPHESAMPAKQSHDMPRTTRIDESSTLFQCPRPRSGRLLGFSAPGHPWYRAARVSLMNRVLRLPSLFSAILLVGACQQLIGLGDYESVDSDEEGGGGGKGGAGGATGGTSGKGGKGGSAGSGVGGSSGKGGTGGKGGTSGRGGSTSEGGESGMGAEGGSGGSNGGKGGSSGRGGGSSGSGNAGTGGSGGKSGCSEITLQGVVGMEIDPPDPSFRSAVFDVAIQQQLVGGAEDFVGFQFYSGDNFDGQQPGSFELGTGVDDNYATCGRCVLVERDAAAVGSAGNTRFYATSGTLDIDDGSEHMDGRPSLTISDVTFVEVTIDPDTYVSTPVEDGDCYHVASYSLELPTPSWDCPATSWGDNICDCGCGIPDLECSSPQVGACESCTGTGSCATTDCFDIDFEDNSQCSASNPTWNCPTSTYGDTFCSCGCGSPDPACESGYVGACDDCDDTGSCDTAGDCTTIDLDDNAVCTMETLAWTCPIKFYGGDDGCDCGCGIVDADCADSTDIASCLCGSGSCAVTCATEIDPTNIGQCL
jgi:hypothetical protein